MIHCGWLRVLSQPQWMRLAQRGERV